MAPKGLRGRLNRGYHVHAVVMAAMISLQGTDHRISPGGMLDAGEDAEEWRMLVPT